MSPSRVDVIRFRLPMGIDPDAALTRLRVVLRPRSSAGSVTTVYEGDRGHPPAIVDVDPERRGWS